MFNAVDAPFQKINSVTHTIKSRKQCYKGMSVTRSIRVILGCMALTALCGCAAHQKAAMPQGAERYRRAAIHEVSEEQLKADGRLIDAVALQETDHLDEALEAYAQLTHDDPSMAVAWYEQGQLLQRRGWSDSALHCIQRAVALQGDNVWYLLALAQSQEMAGDAPGAVATLNRVEALKGVNESLSLHKQRLWEAAGQHDKALKEMESLADAMPQEPRYQAILAEMNMQRKNYRKAKLYYDRILAAAPDNEYIHLQLAEYYKQTGRKAEADSEMVLAFANPRLEAATKLQLLTSFYTEEEFYGSRREVCFRLMETAMRQSDDPSEYAIFYGDMLMRQRRYDEAATQLVMGLQHDSSRYEVWEALLICLGEVPAREEELGDYARRAERLFPMHTLPHYTVAVYARRHSRCDEAIEALEKAVRWGFNKGYLEAETYTLLAECLHLEGRDNEALRCAEHALQLTPKNGTLRLLVDEIKRKQ